MIGREFEMNAFNKFKWIVMGIYLALFVVLSVISCTQNEQVSADDLYAQDHSKKLFGHTRK